MKFTRLLFALLGVGSAFGGIIPVGNSSFENSPTGFGDPAGWTLFTDSASPTFSSNVEVLANDGSALPIVTGVDGSQFVAVNIDHNGTSLTNPDPVIPANGSLAELTSDNLGFFAPNAVYTLTAGVGLDSIQGDTMSVGLALGSGHPGVTGVFPTNSTASFTSSMINGSDLSNDVLVFETITLDTNLDSALVGQPINVSLLYDSQEPFGRRAIFDNVSLSDVSETPEPGSMTLIALGGLAILTKTRWGQRHNRVDKRIG